jgi:Flp pilus assembly protein TadD
VFNASFVFEKESGAGAVDREKTGPTPTTAPKAAAPNKLQEAARAARNSVEQGKYRTAERQYQQILSTDPNNLGALSNLGVVYFRTGNIRAAESTLKKALAIAPNDDFVLTTLGIVHYQQSRFDDALMELRRAIDINPNSATAHN